MEYNWKHQKHSNQILIFVFLLILRNPKHRILNWSVSVAVHQLNKGLAEDLKSPLDDMAASFQAVMMLLHKLAHEYQSVTYAAPTSLQTVKILRHPRQSMEPRNPEDDFGPVGDAVNIQLFALFLCYCKGHIYVHTQKTYVCGMFI